MPGISVGDLGSKLGMKTNDNGWMIFNKVRIPRTDMLDKYIGVTKEGELEVKGDLRSVYQVMVNTRQGLVKDMHGLLHRGCLIATRYAVCRK